MHAAVRSRQQLLPYDVPSLREPGANLTQVILTGYMGMHPPSGHDGVSRARSGMPGPDDPNWYRDAIIYELHVKAFYDSNGDGIGDFRGLIEKLDYLQDLGVTCALAAAVLPLAAARRRLRHRRLPRRPPERTARSTTSRRSSRAAHRRGLRVITELVMNHTSDQHPWFQAARADPQIRRTATTTSGATPTSSTRTRGSSSPTPSARTGPGTRSPRQYFWHRFFSHQPDLNFDNPAVRRRR